LRKLRKSCYGLEGLLPPPEAPFHFSLAGVQLKFSAIMEAKGGLTIPVSGVGGDWIIKLPSAALENVSENEHAMLELARAIDIPVPENHLAQPQDIHGLPVGISGALRGQKALAIRRFDRSPDGTPVHMEDFAQIFGKYAADKYEGHSYGNIATVIEADAGTEHTQEFTRRIAFSVLIGNGDMHLKNWSLLYPDKKTPVLAPAYDFLSTIPYVAEDRLGLKFGGDNNLQGINKTQVQKFTDTVQIDPALVKDTILETVEKTTFAWKTLPQKKLLPQALRKIIDTQIQAAARNISRLQTRK